MIYTLLQLPFIQLSLVQGIDLYPKELPKLTMLEEREQNCVLAMIEACGTISLFHTPSTYKPGNFQILQRKIMAIPRLNTKQIDSVCQYMGSTFEHDSSGDRNLVFYLYLTRLVSEQRRIEAGKKIIGEPACILLDGKLKMLDWPWIRGQQNWEISISSIKWPLGSVLNSMQLNWRAMKKAGISSILD